MSDIGEFGLIDALRDSLPAAVIAGPDLRIGIGDDAAVWTPASGESLVVTTDSLIEGVHFRLDWTDWESLGWKSLAVNLSDIAAMGASPRLVVLSLGLRGDDQVADVQAFYRGVGDLALSAGALVAGGDIVAAPRALTIHVTAIGETRGGAVLRRAGARPGDVIGVSGTIGAAAAGFHLLQLPRDDPRRQATTASTLIAAHLRPEPRLALGSALLAHGATAAMDLSDGLLGDLPKILGASAAGAMVDVNALPVAAAVRALFPDQWLEFATRGGEDYELLFTAPPTLFDEIVAAGRAIDATVTAVGEITSDPRLLMRHLDGTVQPVIAGAFDHFAP
ncbi:MAG TPA: thiamine-phosphate kinase [Thermomicrobiales bacterium]|nr:thiamine-phosphate kinase [Thermomicrobiales bacterium]